MSETTLFLAQLFGVYMLVVGLSGLLRPDRMKKAMDEISNSYVIPYFDGMIALVVGLLIVLNHNVWTDLTTVVITAIGWLAILEGVLMLLLPQKTIMSIMKGLGGARSAMLWSVIALVVGAYLTYVGFFA